MSDVYKAPEAPLQEPRGSGQYGSVEAALEGNYQLHPIEVIKEAWANLKGFMGTFWLAVIVYIVIYAVVAGVIGFATSSSAVSTEFNPAALIGQLVLMFVMGPLGAGLMMIGIRHSVKSSIEVGELFKHFSKIVNLFLTQLLMYIFVGIGFLLLIIPGIYLLVGFSMAMPLVVEKNMGPLEALNTSRKAIGKKWFNMLGFMLVSGLVVFAGLIALVVGLIWAVPVASLAYAIVYRNMFGVEATTLN